MSESAHYDCAVIGGGLAGLGLSVQLAREGMRVIVLEKEHYPFHKVCGEYISLESAGFLESLGVPVETWKLPLMRRLLLSGPSGASVTCDLPLGGMGVSRYKMESALAEMARQAGVTVLDGTKVHAVKYACPLFSVDAGRTVFTASVCCGAFGKHSNLDAGLGRRPPRTRGVPQGYVAIKYHARRVSLSDLVELHFFKDGYLGVSAIEDGKSCICYMVTAARFQACRGQIRELETSLLCRNPHIRELFRRSEILFDRPLAISHPGFGRKSPVAEHLLLAGDASGMIAPLCGNGMSMALHASKIAAGLIIEFLKGRMSREAMELRYQEEWDAVFRKRLYAGSILQEFLMRRHLAGLLIGAVSFFPGLARGIISHTHGRSY